MLPLTKLSDDITKQNAGRSELHFLRPLTAHPTCSTGLLGPSSAAPLGVPILFRTEKVGKISAAAVTLPPLPRDL